MPFENIPHPTIGYHAIACQQGCLGFLLEENKKKWKKVKSIFEETTIHLVPTEIGYL